MRNMYRREFFSSVTKLGVDLLGTKPFHGTADGITYTFLPSKKEMAPTLISVGLRLNEAIYQSNFNVISLRTWPNTSQTPEFWRHVYMRHNLTSNVVLMSARIPAKLPDFVGKVALVLGPNSGVRSTWHNGVPVLFISNTPEMAGAEATPYLPQTAPKSDIFIGGLGGLNIKNSPVYNRIMQFFEVSS